MVWTRSLAFAMTCAGCVGLKDHDADPERADWQATDTAWRDQVHFGDADSDADADADVDADADAGPAPDGHVSGLVDFLYNVNACPECVDPPVATVEVTANARFHAATAGSWTSWLPALGSCVRDPIRSPLAGMGLNLGSWAYLSSGTSTSIGMALDVSTNTYKSGSVDMSAWLNMSSYDLTVPDSGIDVLGAAVTPGGFDDLQPIGILNGADMAFSQGISRENAWFSWAPAGTSDGLTISLLVYDGITYAAKGEILCWAPDSGAFTIPADYFYSPVPYAENDLMFIAIHRYRTTFKANPVDGGLIEAVAKKGVMGTGLLVP